TASEAYNYIVSRSIDCIILDIGLPDMSGIDLILKIKNNNKVNRIPIIIYTGKELEKEEIDVVEKFTESVIKKGPDSYEKLLDKTTLFLHKLNFDMPKEEIDISLMYNTKEKVFENKTILLVDDDMRNVFSLKKILEDKGMKVIIGKNGKMGLQRLKEDPNINIILMDIMMPEMDGYEAIKEIRKLTHFKNIPIIALTAKAMKGDAAKCIESGATDYLAKPVDIEKLFSMLRMCMG
ncbi:MAG: response regulator, partial [Desulfobacterales bacterium]|nr:response regulator [Desulfobacterales bacterium]